MNAIQALRMLADVTATQWGMVTASQAASLGVSRLTLSRLADAGHLQRLTHGVYRDAGAPGDEFDALRAAWLSTQPSEIAEVRLRNLTDGVVVSGASAARLHQIGDLPADRHEFTTPRRRQTQRPEIHYRTRRLPRQDVTLARGLPVTTKERTIADLVEARTDLSLAADALGDTLRNGRLDLARLRTLLDPLAARTGFPAGRGSAVLDRLVEMSGSLSGLSQAIQRLTDNHAPTMSSIATIASDLRALDTFAHGGSRD